MSDKRIQVLHGDLDKKALDWLDSQTNMSATIRLMIHQASRGSNDDYVMKCAKESSGIFGGTSQISQTAPTEPVKRVAESKPEPEVAAVQQETTHKPTEPETAVYIEPVQEKTVEKVEPETIKTITDSDTPVVQNESIKTEETETVDERPSPKPKQSVNWDQMDDEKNDTISRMMADLGRS